MASHLKMFIHFGKRKRDKNEGLRKRVRKCDGNDKGKEKGGVIQALWVPKDVGKGASARKVPIANQMSSW